MTNFYEVLNLDMNKKLDEINADLSRIESTWKRREITNPEKATTMLALIIQARKIFASDAARKAYDNDLNNSRGTAPDEEQGEVRRKWVEQAKSYYMDEQYDLAVIAVEKAIALLTADDAALFALAADIYWKSNNLKTAMDYINRAIVNAPDISMYYLSKGLIYEEEALQDYQYTAKYHAEARKMFLLADREAEKNGDMASRARACGALAFSYYYQDPVNREKAEKLANLAVSYGGDSLGNAERVIADINALREKERLAEERKAQQEWLKKQLEEKESIYNEAKALEFSGMHLSSHERITKIEEAIAKLKTIIGYKDSEKLIEDYTNRIQMIIDDESSWQRMVKTIHKMIKILIIAILFYIVILNYPQHKCGEHLKWNFDDKTGELSITGYGDMYNYSRNEGITVLPWNRKRPWNKISPKIKNIVIEEGCKCIGEFAFYECENVESVTIPESVEIIGLYSFGGCDSLESVEIPESVEIIRGYSFWGCDSLESVEIPESVITIEGEAFMGSGLKFVTIPKSVKAIGVEAFMCCSSLESVVISEGTEIIDRWAFCFCSSLESVMIPEGVETIERGAFSNCSNLEEITIPKSVKTIGDSAFFGCKEGCTIYYSGTKEEWHSLASEIGFNGSVYCLDGSYIYQHTP